MKIPNYEIEDMCIVLGLTFNIDQLKIYYYSNHDGEHGNFKKYLDQLIDDNIIDMEGDLYKMNCKKYLSGASLPENIKNILNYFYDSFYMKILLECMKI